MSDRPTLKHCPFCASENVTAFRTPKDGSTVVACNQCGSQAPAAIWNDRCDAFSVPNAKRAKVYGAIDSERAYQQSKWGVEQVQSVASFITFMQHHLTRAIAEVSTKHTHDDALEQVRKVTTLGVACMEEHGAPRREGF